MPSRRLLDCWLAPLNYPYWGGLLLPWTGIAYLYARTIYPALGWPFWLAFGATELRVLLAMGLSVLVGNMVQKALGRLGELSVHAAFVFLTLLYAVGVLVFSINSMTLSEVARYLFSGEAAGMWAMLKYSGTPSQFVVALFIALALFALLGLGLLALTQRLASRRGWRAPLKALVALCYLAAALLLAEQALSARLKNPLAWFTEQRASPLYVPVLSPRGYATYSAVAAPPRRRLKSAGLALAPAGLAEDVTVLLVVLESCRPDFITPETTPNLHRFQRENLSFPQAWANGNATLLSWYAILNSGHPLHWKRILFERDPDGSPALDVLRRAGFRQSVFASSDLSYYNIRSVAFGRGDRLADVRMPDPALDCPQNDRRATRALLRALAAHGGKGRRLYSIFLDSTHPFYYWPPDFEAKFKPYNSLGLANKDVFVDGRIVSQVVNRYKNSLRFVDGLFGEIVAGLKARGLYEKAVIIVVGDHGQEFMEHGAFSHASNLFNPQIRIPLIMRLPGASRRPAGMASQVDILPTLLDYLGLGKEAARLMAGRSLLRGGDPAILTMAYSSGEPSRFVLNTGRYKIEFSLIPVPGVIPLSVWRVSDLEDRPIIPGRGAPADYQAFLDREFVPRLKETGVVTVLPPARNKP